MGRQSGGMWSEARKQEGVIRGAMVDLQRRQERRANYYERIKQDPAQFLRLYGIKAKLHLNPSEAEKAESSSVMQPWQGDPSVLIDRFDVRSHLDAISANLATSAKKTDSDSDSDENAETKADEADLNYERYKTLVQNDFIGLAPEVVLRHIQLDEEGGSTSSDSKKKESGNSAKAAIGYNYDTAMAAVPIVGRGGDAQEEDSDDSEGSFNEAIDLEVTLDADKLEADQRAKIGTHSKAYGLKKRQFVDRLKRDKEEQEALKLAKMLEDEKAQYSGRKGRHKRREFHEERLLLQRRGNPNPFEKPCYAKSDDDEEKAKKRSASRSSSSSRKSSVEKEPEFITTFEAPGAQVDSPEPEKKGIEDPPVVKIPKKKRSRSRSISYDRSRKDRKRSTSRNRYRRRSRSRSRRRSRDKRSRRSRERRSRERYSRERRRSRGRRSPRERRSRDRRSRSRDRRSRSREKRRERSTSRPKRHRSRTRSRSEEKNAKASRRSQSTESERPIEPQQINLLESSGNGTSGQKKRYRRKDLSSDSEKESEKSPKKTPFPPLINKDDERKEPGVSNGSASNDNKKSEVKNAAGKTKLSAAERMKRRMEKQLEKTIKMDKLNQALKAERLEQQRIEWEERQRIIQEEYREAHPDSDRSRSRSKSRSPKSSRSNSPDAVVGPQLPAAPELDDPQVYATSQLHEPMGPQLPPHLAESQIYEYGPSQIPESENRHSVESRSKSPTPEVAGERSRSKSTTPPGNSDYEEES